jgi:hypothetical protein
MVDPIYLGWSVLALLGGANLAASVVVIRGPHFDGGQKAVQLVLVWLLPVVGAVICWSFSRNARIDEVFPDESETSGAYDQLQLPRFLAAGARSEHPGSGHPKHWE